MHLHPPYLDILVGSSETEGTDCLGSASGPPAHYNEAGIVEVQEVQEEGRRWRRCRWEMEEHDQPWRGLGDSSHYHLEVECNISNFLGIQLLF